MNPAHQLAGLATAAILAASAVTSLGAQEKLDLSSFPPGTLIDEVIIPVPSEVFEVLDKLGEPNWRSEMRPQDNANVSTRFELALQFGVVVADGFIAVQAQDRQAIQNLGREVQRLANKLALDEPVLRHAQSIMDSAERNDYQAVRDELDRTERTVREEMERMRDEELAQCVSIGGWLRGTEVVTSIVSKSYSKEKAELLHQPDLVLHFRDSIAKMKRSVRGSGTMKAVVAGLETLRSRMGGSEDGMIPVDAVGEMHATCRDLIVRITTGKEPEGAGRDR